MSGKRLAVIGHPVAHSLSPVMQDAALAAASIPGSYVAIDVDAENLATTIGEFTHTLDGFNVTIPHKAAVMPLLDGLDAFAASIGAVNTVVRCGPKLFGYNTDRDGFLLSLQELHSFLAGKHALVFGSGGSARAVISALHQLKMCVTVASRFPERVDVDRVETCSSDGIACLKAISSAALVVNATPLGLPPFECKSPVPDGAVLDPAAVVVDLVYGHVTPFQDWGRTFGCRTVDGLEMLVQQGALAFKLWTDREADIMVMRRACLSQLKESDACSAS